MYSENDLVKMFNAVLMAEKIVDDANLKAQLCKVSELVESLLVERGSAGEA
jgi:hypothetical protein